MTSKPWRTVASVAIAMAAGVVTAAAAPPKKALPPAQPQAVPSSGLMVAVDERGQIRQPTREEAQALIQQVEKMFEIKSTSAKVTQWPDGTMSAELGEAYGNLYLARIAADGAVSSTCVDNAAAAAQFLGGAAGLEEK
jgi:hypothetical protein